MSCPLCDSYKNDRIGKSLQMYQCRKCGTVHGTCYKGDSYEYVKPWFAKEPVPSEQLKYFDIITLGAGGIERRHGWFDPETKLIHQTG